MAAIPGPDLPVLLIQSGGRKGMACVVSARFAITVAHLVEGPAGHEATVVLTQTDERRQRFEGRVVWSDLKTDVAVLEIPPLGAGGSPGNDLRLDEKVPAKGSRWRAWFPHEGSALREFSGSVAGRLPSRAELSLRIEDGPPAQSVLPGTPVFSQDGLIGLVIGPGVGDLRSVAASAIQAALSAAHRAGEQPVDGSNAVSGGISKQGPGKRRGPGKKGAIRADPPAGTPPATPTVPADLFDRLSDSSRKALSHADGMRAAMGQAEVHMEHLLLALYQKDGGPTRKELARAGIGEATLRERLGTIAERPMPAWGAYVAPTLTAIPPHSAHVAAALVAADEVARELEAKEVQSRHLFHGVLSVSQCTAVGWMIDEFGVDADRIDMAAEPSKPVSAAAARARAEYAADLAEGDDLLDVKGEAEAICAIVAAHDTSPPLSIGLFGDWGTGKTFFMGLMEKRIEKLKETARTTPGSAYCSNIVQLRFNAWHYIDTDLWASLTAEIFDGLAAALRKEAALAGGERPEEQRARLLAATTHLRDARTETERRKADADAALKASEERLDALARDERDLAARLSPRALLKATYRYVAGEPETARALESGAERLGIPKAKALASDTRAQLLEVHGAWGDLKAIYIALRSGSSRLWLLFLAITLLALLLAFVFIRDTGALARIAVSAATALAGALAVFTPVLREIRAGLRTIRHARAESDSVVEAERERRRKALQDAHAAVQKRVLSEEDAIDRINAELAELETQLALLRADRQMADFIWEKQASTDYTRHFGVIARARHDFTRLSALLNEVVEQQTDPKSSEEEGGGTAEPVPRIDRIVLYIDDLDRCPEKKVVDVLQAVHLLLAFPLFIVVVGVDSRWLLHSLREHASVFRARDDDGAVIDEEDQVHWESTPFNYLEKIFQIPFNLRPMDGAGFAKLIDKLTISAQKEEAGAGATKGSAKQREEERSTGEEAGRNAAEPAAAGPAPPPPAPGRSGGETPTPRPPVPETAQAPIPMPRHGEGEEEVDPDPPFLSISPEERAFMHEMHRLIPTPRAAKRYVNVYRLFRASLTDSRRERLEAHEAARSRRVLLLLAIVTGFPQEGAVILRELVERQPTGGWWDFVNGLAAEYTRHVAEGTEILGGVPKPRAGANGTAPSDYERQRAQRWEELQKRLALVREQVALGDGADPPCAEFAEWAKFVARYSFESGRVLTAREQTAR